MADVQTTWILPSQAGLVAQFASQGLVVRQRHHLDSESVKMVVTGSLQATQRAKTIIIHSHVFGLTRTPKMTPYVHFSPHGAPTSFSILQLADIYHFPASAGAGQKIGIIELGGGYLTSDIRDFLDGLGLQSVTPNLTDVSVDGAVNNPAGNANECLEVTLDVEIIVGLVPEAALRIYFAPNTGAGFFNAISQALQDGCGVVSISWGSAENLYDAQTLNAFNNLFATAKAVIYVAAGDLGSSDGQAENQVDFPSSAPHAIGCGGTSLSLNPDRVEVVWNNGNGSATGGGISRVFPVPDYQSANVTNYQLNMRGVPDICAVADPNTGYQVRFRGADAVVGGTSCVAPLWSGLTGRLNQLMIQNQAPPIASTAAMQNVLYQHASQICNDIVQGDNGSYSALPKWDPCTGNGSPQGEQILKALLNQPLDTTDTSTESFPGWAIAVIVVGSVLFIGLMVYISQLH